MKYLVIAALVSLAFIFIYSRLRPYLQAIYKVITFLNGANSSAGQSTTKNPALEHKLIRCVSCGTWIPANRAITLSSGLATYCSQDCLEKRAEVRDKKKAG
jgi:hypothetical protein